jgi:hypothetical protein
MVGGDQKKEMTVCRLPTSCDGYNRKFGSSASAKRQPQTIAGIVVPTKALTAC